MLNIPIPFIGAKRNWCRRLKSILSGLGDGDGLIVVDLFGGSGYCSLLAKRVLPKATVIYNDYDDYTKQFAKLPACCALMTEIKSMLNDGGVKKGERIPSDMMAKIIGKLKALKEAGDYIEDVFRSQLCFQFSKIDLDAPKENMFNKTTSRDYLADVAQYDNLVIVHDDWTAIYDKYKGKQNVIFILDPPYPMTLQTHYKGYSFLNNQLKIIDLLKAEANVLLFTSEKSFILDCYQWKYGNDDAKIKTVKRSLRCVPTKQVNNDEILLYKLTIQSESSVIGSIKSEGMSEDKKAESVDDEDVDAEDVDE